MPDTTTSGSGPSEAQKRFAANLASAAGYEGVEEAAAAHHAPATKEGYSALIDILRIASRNRQPAPEIVSTGRVDRALSLVPRGTVEIPAPPGLTYDRDSPPGTSPQKAAIENILEQEGTLLGGDMGIGKTIIALGAINADPDTRRVLVVSPKSTISNWEKEAKKWLVEDRPVVWVERGKPYNVPETGPVLVLTQYETFQAPGKYDVRGKLKEEVWDMAVLDESHKLKNPDTLRSQAIFGTYGDFRPDFSGPAGMMPEARQSPIRARRRVAMTGTLQDKDVSELYGPLAWTDPAAWAPTKREFGRFNDRYMGYIVENDRVRRSGVNPGRADELWARMLNTSLLRYEKDELLPDLPPIDRRITMMEPVDGAQRTGTLVEPTDIAFRQVQNVASLQGGVSAGEVMQSLGIDRTELTDTITQTGLAKAPAVAAYAAEAAKSGDDVIVFANRQAVVDRMAEELERYGIPHFAVTGKTPVEERQELVRRFQDGEGKVFLASIGTMSEGLTLTRANRLIFAEPDWSASRVAQAEARAHRMGQTRPVLVEYMILADSVDGMQVGKIVEKAEAAMGTVGISQSSRVHKAYDAEGREITNVGNDGVSARRGSKSERQGQISDEERLFLGYVQDQAGNWAAPDISDEEMRERQAEWRKEVVRLRRAEARVRAGEALPEAEEPGPPAVVPEAAPSAAWEANVNPAAVPAPSDMSAWEQAEEVEPSVGPGSEPDSPLVRAALEMGAVKSVDQPPDVEKAGLVPDPDEWASYQQPEVSYAPADTSPWEQTPAERVRRRIGNAAPTEEFLVSVYVNADAEERAYLDSLGVGDLAERHGHRVTTEDAALVEDALDDGWVTSEEASAAGRVQNLAEQETPDPLVPSYEMTRAEFEERIRELCDDPAAFAAFEEQVEAQAVAAKAERTYKARQQAEDPAAAAAQDVSDGLRSEAGEALKQRSVQARAQREDDGDDGEEAAPRRRTWTAKQLRAKAREICPPASAIRLTRKARKSTLPKAPRPPSTAAPKSGRPPGKPAFTAGMRR